MISLARRIRSTKPCAMRAPISCMCSGTAQMFRTCLAVGGCGPSGWLMTWGGPWKSVITAPRSRLKSPEEAPVYDFAATPEAELVEEVRGPAGTKLRFIYNHPAGDYPAALNEMFLTRVERLTCSPEIRVMRQESSPRKEDLR